MQLTVKLKINSLYLDLQISIQASGEAHPTVFGKRTLAAIPGNTIIHIGNSFR